MWDTRGMRGVLALSPCGWERHFPPLSTMEKAAMWALVAVLYQVEEAPSLPSFVFL